MSSFILKQISNKISNELFLEALELTQANIKTLEKKDLKNIFSHISSMNVSDTILQNFFDSIQEYDGELLKKEDIVRNLMFNEKWEFLAINHNLLNKEGSFLEWSILSGYESLKLKSKEIDNQKNKNVELNKEKKEQIELELFQKAENNPQEKIVELFNIKGVVPSYSEEILTEYKNKLIDVDNKFTLEQSQLNQKKQRLINSYTQKLESSLNHLNTDEKNSVLRTLFAISINKDSPLLLEDVLNNDREKNIINELKDEKAFSEMLELTLSKKLSKESILTLISSIDWNDKVSKPDHKSPILLAVKYGRVDLIHGIVDSLYQNQKENFLKEAMVQAAQQDQVECMQLIRQMGIPFHLTNKITGDSLLHYAVKAGAERSQKFLLKRGLKMNILNSFGVSPQMLLESISEKLRKPTLENSGNVIPLFKK